MGGPGNIPLPYRMLQLLAGLQVAQIRFRCGNMSAASASILKPTLLTQALRVLAGAVALLVVLVWLRRLMKRGRGQAIDTKGQIVGGCKHVGRPQSICQECWAGDPEDRFCETHAQAGSNV